MNNTAIKILLWLFFWPVLLPIFALKALFPVSEEEAKRRDILDEGLRESQRDSLLFGETHRKY